MHFVLPRFVVVAMEATKWRAVSFFFFFYFLLVLYFFIFYFLSFCFVFLLDWLKDKLQRAHPPARPGPHSERVSFPSLLSSWTTIGSIQERRERHTLEIVVFYFQSLWLLVPIRTGFFFSENSHRELDTFSQPFLKLSTTVSICG
jgi:hypothetical protein